MSRPDRLPSFPPSLGALQRLDALTTSWERIRDYRDLARRSLEQLERANELIDLQRDLSPHRQRLDQIESLALRAERTYQRARCAYMKATREAGQCPEDTIVQAERTLRQLLSASGLAA